MRPLDSMTSGALSPPLAGKPWLIGDIRLQVAPRSVEMKTAIGRSGEGDPLAAHPRLVDGAEPRIRSLLDLRVLAGAGGADLGDRTDEVGGCCPQSRTRAGDQGQYNRAEAQRSDD